MAVFNLKSTAISNRDATPKVLTDALVSNGEVLSAEGYVQSGSAADSVGSTYKLVHIPSNARVRALFLRNDAFGGSAAINLGVYYPSFIPGGGNLNPALAGTVISANLFASAYSVVAAGAAEVINQSGSITIAKMEMPLWQMAGLAADPMIDLDIVAAVSTVFAASGYIGLEATYVKQ